MNEAALKAMFEKENVDAVIHCAALKSVGESVQKPLEYYRNNITGTLTLMDVMKQTSVKNIDKLKVLIMYEVIRFMNYLFFYSNLIYLWKVKYHYFMHISKHSVSYGIRPSATNWKPINKLKKPVMHLAASLQAVAHGSDSVLYFQLRQSQGASEKFRGAVIDHYGKSDTKEAGIIAPVEFAPKEISINTRESENAEYLFIQNFWKKAVGVPVREGYKVIYGKKNEIVEPLKTRILKREK